MNSLQRTLAAATFGNPDRPPVFLMLWQQGAKELEMPLPQYYRDGASLAEGQTRLLEKYGHDCVVGIPHVVEDTIPFGTKLRYHDCGPPSLAGMAIRHYEEILGMKAPVAADHPQLRETLRAIETLAQRFHGEVPVLGAVIAPWSLPSMIMGTKKFIALLKDDTGKKERYFEPLMQMCLEYSTRWARAQIDAGVDILVLADGISSADIITAEELVREALPLTRRAIAKIPGIKAYEFVGRAEPFMQYYRDLDVVAFLIGSDDDLPRCRAALGDGNKALIGNINNIKLVHWSRDRAYYECRRALKVAADPRGGFILANQGPEIPFFVPEENILAFRQAVDARRPAVATA